MIAFTSCRVLHWQAPSWHATPYVSVSINPFSMSLKYWIIIMHIFRPHQMPIQLRFFHALTSRNNGIGTILGGLNNSMGMSSYSTFGQLDEYPNMVQPTPQLFSCLLMLCGHSPQSTHTTQGLVVFHAGETGLEQHGTCCGNGERATTFPITTKVGETSCCLLGKKKCISNFYSSLFINLFQNFSQANTNNLTEQYHTQLLDSIRNKSTFSLNP